MCRCGRSTGQRYAAHVGTAPRRRARVLVHVIAAGHNKLAQSAVHGMDVAVHEWLLAFAAKGVAVGKKSRRVVKPARVLEGVGLAHSSFVPQVE